MASHARDEVEAEFRVFWQTGAAGEDWDAWCDRFSEDAVHHEHQLARHQGAIDFPGLTRLKWPASPASASPGGRK